MRIRFWDRLLSAVSGLMVFFLGVCVFVFGVGVLPFKVDVSVLEGPFELWHRLVMIGAALVLCALGIHSLSLLFRRRRDKGFIMQHTELGDMSISMQAMENMVKRCIDTREELKVTHTRILRVRDGVTVDIRVSLANGANIPLTVNALQKQIKHYITSCSGVDVKEVRVMVETNNNQLPMSAEVVAPDMAAAEACMALQSPHPTGGFTGVTNSVDGEVGKEPIHQRIFKREETPQIVPPPPVEELSVERMVEEVTEVEAEAVEIVVEAPQEDAPVEEPEAEEDGTDEDSFEISDEEFENILVTHEEKENE